MRSPCRASLLVLLLAGAAPAAAPPRAVSFRDDVLPILAAPALGRHQGSTRASSVRLDARSEILGEGNGRPLAVAGRADRSRLLAVVRGEVADKRMPPAGRGKRLSERQIEALRA